MKVLITGAAGFIGGSVLVDLLAKEDLIPKNHLFAVVRSADQATVLKKLGVNVVQLDLSDGQAIHGAIVTNKIDAIINAAASFNPDMVSHLIKGLGQVQKDTGRQTYFIHSSVTAVYTPQGGWPEGQVKDSDSGILAKEKELMESQGYNPVRATNILVAELSKELGVKSFNVVLPTVYGRGSGPWRKISVKLPTLITIFTKDRVVHHYERNANETAGHISDITSFYSLLLSKITSVDEGYYFAFSHTCPNWKAMQTLANLLHERGLVDSKEVKTWPSDEVAAQKLNFPVEFIGTMLSNSGENMVAEKAYAIGWKPEWDEEKFLSSLNVEINDALELIEVKPTLFDTLMKKT